MNKQELATKIWSTANALRKNIKASEYKDYILGFMFYKYLCDKEIDYLHDFGGEIENLKDADSAVIEMFKDGLGYYIPYQNLFSVWKESGTNLGAKDVSEALDDFYLNLNGRYKTVFDNVFSALQSGLSKLGDNSGSRDKAVRDIVDLVDNIPATSKNYDVLGYIYEYLIQQFSSEAKRDGAFYTPHELTSLMSRILAERLKDRDEIYCYDPCVGSAGLLLNVGKEIGRYVPSDNIKYYGQELISETANLSKINLFMQGVPVQNINIRNANTLEEDWPYFDEHTAYSPLFVDAVLTNPPYSAHYEPEKHQTDERFKGYGLPPSSKADYAFLLHCLYHLKSNGVMAIVLPHGVLFRGDSEAEIRKNLLLNHNIETIISLPGQLFFATGIPVVVMILSKGRKEDDVFFIDASQSYEKGKKQNVLRESDVQRIFDAVVARKDIPNYAHLASMEEIEANDYNLNVPRYISAKIDEAPYDLYSVMTGKVSNEELKSFDEIWQQFPGLKGKLVEKDDDEYNVFSDVNGKTTAFEDNDVREFMDGVSKKASDFGKYLENLLISPSVDNSVYHEIVEKLFNDFKNVPIVDTYDVFQSFVDMWRETVEEDIERLSSEGWSICAETEPNMVTKKDSKTKKTVEEQKGWKGKIIPFDLVKSEYFEADFDLMKKLNAEADSKASEYADIWDSLDDEIKGELSKEDDETSFDAKKIKAAIKAKEMDEDVIQQLQDIVDAIDAEKSLRKEIKGISSALDNKAKDKIESLSGDEVNYLLRKKWIDPIVNGFINTAKGTINSFISDFEEVRKKYADPLSDVSEEIEVTSEALQGYLSELVGSEKDMAAIQLLMEEL